jgi:hypothetical protein
VWQGKHGAEEPNPRCDLQDELQMYDNNALGVIEGGCVPDEGWWSEEGVGSTGVITRGRNVRRPKEWFSPHLNQLQV